MSETETIVAQWQGLVAGIPSLVSCARWDPYGTRLAAAYDRSLYIHCLEASPASIGLRLSCDAQKHYSATANRKRE